MADIDRVGLGNAALQKVLEHLLLSKELKGKDRGFISYAELGVNQLQTVLLLLTAAVAILTVVPGRAKPLQGGLHLVLFAAFLFLSIAP